MLPSGNDMDTYADDLAALVEALDLKQAVLLHGDDDQIVPIAASARLSAKLVKGATLNVYPGLPHGLCSTHKELVNADLLAFIKG